MFIPPQEFSRRLFSIVVKYFVGDLKVKGERPKNYACVVR